MFRRQFLQLVPAAAGAAQRKKQAAPPPPPSSPAEQVRALFLDITRGYLSAAARTSPSMAVVEYPNATVTKGFLTSRGLSITGVTRMLPALAAWIAGAREPALDLLAAVVAAFRNGTNPNHADYWQAAKPGVWDQRQVESSIVAWSLFLLRDRVLPALSAAERSNVAAWLASCTVTPVRSSNWAWFTAVNLAVRQRLSEQYPEFQPDEAFMLADLKALDGMAAGDSGWYNDDATGAAFDYYNSWVFASHFLYWNEVIGARYPELRARFSTRLERYLETAPYFFAGHGGHVLYGRSLIYRWAVLTPLVLAYQQKLWPHPPGLLRRIVEQNILWHAAQGALDKESAKLRESLTAQGAAEVKESYIDGGHPYWGMQAFAFWRLPDSDPLFQAAPEPLPVEKSDYAIALSEPGLLVVGARSSGQVRLYNSRSTRSEAHYRDKYNKLVYSSHFAFAVNHDKDHPTWDNTLVLRNRRSGLAATRGEFTSTSIEAEKIELEYEIRLGPITAVVQTEIQFQGEFESRIHRLRLAGGALDDIEVWEGGAAYTTTAYPEAHLKTWSLKGWKESGSESSTGSVLFGACQVQTLKAPAAERMLLAALRYQSPKALPKDKVDGEANFLLARLRL